VDQQNDSEVGLTLDANSPLDDVCAALREGLNFGKGGDYAALTEGRELNRAILRKEQRFE
jgi:hypothetical protein